MANITSHKRNLSSGEEPASKKSNIADVLNSIPVKPDERPISLAKPRYVYLVEREDDYGYKMQSNTVEGVFESFEDAESHVYKQANNLSCSWSRERSEYGTLLRLESDDSVEGSVIYNISEIELRPKGSVKKIELQNSAVSVNA
jgi:hypothetical protein